MADVQKVTLELTVDELNVVLAGLGELPAKTSIGLIDKIRVDASKQLQAQQPAAEVVQ